jgi:hypothetical protein
MATRLAMAGRHLLPALTSPVIVLAISGLAAGALAAGFSRFEMARCCVNDESELRSPGRQEAGVDWPPDSTGAALSLVGQ